jgi:2-succinyl-5-enolpyruvyl-6-hydroxy-3-cyclohexene-1-carboxylate synthase
VLTTSGTAAANLLPAVTEAHHAAVPLLVLTADRPPELRDVGALQAIDQVRLFGSRAKWSVDVPLPDDGEPALHQVRSLAARAVEHSLHRPRGPVHLNLPLREPLIPAPAALTACGPPVLTWRHGSARLDHGQLVDLAEVLDTSERGLLVCGPHDDAGLPAALVELGRALGLPVLADGLSGIRHRPDPCPFVLDAYDAFLRRPELERELRPDVILRFGAVPVSKPLQRYLAHHRDCRQLLVEPADGFHDPDLTASELIRAAPAPLCRDLAPLVAAAGPGRVAWTTRWQRLDAASRAAITELLAARDALSEPGVMVELGRTLPAGATVFVSSSMPVRDLDGFLGARAAPLRVLANRGASGIDGVLSSGLGAAAVSDGPTVVVLGDLAFAHDLGGLLAAARFDLRATVLVIDNDGGGIFSFLPQHDHGEHFEELFGAPHGLDLGRAGNLYGIEVEEVSTRADLAAALTRSLDHPDVQIIHLRTSREANAKLHEQLWAAAVAATTTEMERARP